MSLFSLPSSSQNYAIGSGDGLAPKGLKATILFDPVQRFIWILNTPTYKADEHVKVNQNQ